MKKYVNYNILTHLILIIVGGYWYKLALDLDSERAVDTTVWGTVTTFPKLAVILFLALNIIALIKECVQTGKAEKSEKKITKSIIPPVIMIVVMLVYTIVIQSVGFIISNIVLMAVALILFGERRWQVIVLFPTLFTGFLYVVFRYLLSVNLP